jgi:hypothetical protein
VPNQSDQLGFVFRSRGGKRCGAGRKRLAERPRVSHKTRPILKHRFPVHVTSRMRRDIVHLRSGVCFRVLKRSFCAANQRFGFRLIHFSVQGNHLHFIVEADDARSLSRGMQGLHIRMATALNRLMQRKGKVFNDRYHAVILQTPTQAAHALHYVLHNRQHHAPGRYPSTWRDPFASTCAPLLVPRTWLLDEAEKLRPVSACDGYSSGACVRAGSAFDRKRACEPRSRASAPPPLSGQRRCAVSSQPILDCRTQACR